MLLDSVDSKSFSKNLFKHLVQSKNVSIEKCYDYCVAKFDSTNKLELNCLKNHCFEIAYGTNDVISRIETLMKWNEITCSPKWIKQTNFSYIFGFGIRDLSIFYNYVCSSLIIGASYFKENKIYLVNYLKNAIEKEIEHLMPTLILRFYEEEILRSKNKNILNSYCNFTDEENLRYRLILSYMYLISLLKCPSFNQETMLRTKLVCNSHHKNNVESKFFEICPCLYGADEETLVKLIKREIKREDLISIEKLKWFESLFTKDDLELKYERKDKLIEMMKKQSYHESIWSDIAICWKVKINQTE